MKSILTILSVMFNKLFTITVTIIMLLLTELLLSTIYQKDSSSQQIMISITLIITSLMCIVFIQTLVDKGPYRLVNYIFSVIMFILGIFLGNDYTNRPDQLSPISNEYTISETKTNKVIVEIDYESTPEFGHSEPQMLFMNKSNLKYDSIHPLILYSAYRIDIFGDKTPGKLYIKSDLMDKYVFIH